MKRQFKGILTCYLYLDSAGRRTWQRTAERQSSTSAPKPAFRSKKMEVNQECCYVATCRAERLQRKEHLQGAVRFKSSLKDIAT